MGFGFLVKILQKNDFLLSYTNIFMRYIFILSEPNVLKKSFYNFDGRVEIDRQSKDSGSNPGTIESVFFATERFSNYLKIREIVFREAYGPKLEYLENFIFIIHNLVKWNLGRNVYFLISSGIFPNSKSHIEKGPFLRKNRPNLQKLKFSLSLGFSNF